MRFLFIERPSYFFRKFVSYSVCSLCQCSLAIGCNKIHYRLRRKKKYNKWSTQAAAYRKRLQTVTSSLINENVSNYDQTTVIYKICRMAEIFCEFQDNLLIQYALPTVIETKNAILVLWMLNYIPTMLINYRMTQYSVENFQSSLSFELTQQFTFWKFCFLHG